MTQDEKRGEETPRYVVGPIGNGRGCGGGGEGGEAVILILIIPRVSA